MTAFRITAGKGFHLTFPNGYTISVQFGPANYCSNYGEPINNESDRMCGKRGSETAETAIIAPNGKIITVADEEESLRAYQTVEQVLERMIQVSKFPQFGQEDTK